MAEAEGDVGGYDVDFVNKPDDSLYCPICLLVARDAMQHGDCGKLFCKNCIEKYQRTKTDCPCCKGNEAKFFPDSRSNQQIRSLQVRCENKQDGCQWEGELRQSAEHANDKCKYRQMECPLGCGINMKWIAVDFHQKEECKNHPRECPECQEEGKYWYITTTHMEVCPMVLTTCPNSDCDVEICAGLVLNHVNTDCEFTPVECKYKNIGCKEILRRKDMEEHENNDKYHLPILIGTVTAQQDTIDYQINILQFQQDEIMDLKHDQQIQQDHIDALRHDLGVQQDHIDNLKHDLQHQQGQIHGLTQSLQLQQDKSKSAVSKVKKRIDKMQYTICTIQNFHIQGNFNKLFRFEATPHTYKMGAHICYNEDGRYPQCNVRISYSMWKGENDDQLQWPFSGTIKVELLNQQEDKDHYSKNIRIQQALRVHPSQPTPIQITCYEHFISHQHLEKFAQKYYPNQTLYFRITVIVDSSKPWLC